MGWRGWHVHCDDDDDGRGIHNLDNIPYVKLINPASKA
jgi:hypothetical protein